MIFAESYASPEPQVHDLERVRCVEEVAGSEFLFCF
jgi:hypothetical protein